MKNIISAIFVLFLFGSCTNKVYYSASWQGRQVIVDGNIPEWSIPLRFYDQETGISYCISNDNYNLYFCCSISNEFLQTKILRAGLEFRIDTLGKKSFPVGITYPSGNLPETSPDQKSDLLAKDDPNLKRDRSALKLKLLAEAREIELAGFKSNLGKFISVIPKNNTGISAAINFDNRGSMNYEAVIPFSTFYKNKLSPSDSNRVFNYEIKIKPVDKSDNRENGGIGMRSSGMRGGGRNSGGMRGGGMRGGGMNGGRTSGEYGGNTYNRNSNISGTTKTTIKLKLAYK
jgi:uncharacterized membrane protein YgcG